MLFDLFVVNRKAIAVQTSDGSYRTQYVTVTANDILCMLQEKKSLGTYQQLYKTPFLKWICLDFDCNDKSNPDLDCLYVECIKPINDFLSSKLPPAEPVALIRHKWPATNCGKPRSSAFHLSF